VVEKKKKKKSRKEHEQVMTNGVIGWAVVHWGALHV
jgi:hypothetical protein